ncbi:protein N-lysine methyltransferase METTL21D-like [Ciona intestinalis]
MDLQKTFVRTVDVARNETELTLSIHQVEHGDVGCVVWDAALVLLKYLATPSGRKYVQNKCVIELGAGTGVVGLSADIVGASKVILTDLPHILPLIDHNIKENTNILAHSKAEISGSTLRWGNTTDIKNILRKHLIDCVLISDCVYYEDGLDNLIETIIIILNSNPSATVLCSYEKRDTGNKIELLNKFLTALQDELNVVFVPFSEMDEIYRSDDINIIVVTKS